MIGDIEERKRKIAEYHETEYRRPRKWWQPGPGKFEKTSEVRPRCKTRWLNETEIIIRNDKRKAIGSIAFLFFIWVMILIGNHGDREAILNMLFGGTLFTGLLVYDAWLALDKRDKIIINTEGIWLIELNELVKWEHVVSSYIKTDSSGESEISWLVIHYYDKDRDGFFTTEMSLERLDKSSEEIAMYIEELKGLKEWNEKLTYQLKDQ